jgi:hypothetical protein
LVDHGLAAKRAKEVFLNPAHIGGGMLGRAAQITGAGLALMGAKGIVAPSEKNASKLSMHNEIVRPMINHATPIDPEKMEARLRRRQPVAKRLPESEWNDLQRRRRRQRKIALTSGTLGVSALALRGPDAVKFAVRHNPEKLKMITPAVKHSQHASNLLGTGSIGIGSMGAFNSAKMAHLEHEHDNELQRLSNMASSAVRKDAWLDKYRDRISPSAEHGYKHLKGGRNEARGTAVGSGLLSAGSGAAAIGALRRGNKVDGAMLSAAALSSGIATYQQGKKAHTWNKKLGKIKAKGEERAAQGIYGKDREVAKAFGLIRPPKPPKLGPSSIRRATLRRGASGAMVNVKAAPVSGGLR